MDCTPLPSGEQQPAQGLIDFDQAPGARLMSGTTNSLGQA